MSDQPVHGEECNVTATKFRLTILTAMVMLLVAALAAPAMAQYPPPPEAGVGGISFWVECPPDEDGGDPVPRLGWDLDLEDLDDIDPEDYDADILFVDADGTAARNLQVPLNDGMVLWPDTRLENGEVVALPGFERDSEGNWVLDGDQDAFPRGEVNINFTVPGLPDGDAYDDLRETELGVTYPFEGQDCDPEPVFDPDTDVEDDVEEREPEEEPEEEIESEEEIETEDEIQIEHREEAETDVLGVTIPRTGAELLVLLAVGATLLLGGAVVLMARRRRSDPTG